MLIIFLILGLIVGSFLNVVVERLNLAETILGRSHCPHCKKTIRWYDNVPVLSFMVLRARCRDCEGKISWQYPIVEILTGVIFALAGNYFFSLNDPQSWMTAFFYLVIFSLFIIIAVYDFKFMEIPMIIVWLGAVWTISYYLYADWTVFSPALGILSLKIYSGALAGLMAFLIFFLLSAGTREKWMGLGDAYAAMLVGVLVGWPNIFWALILAFATGAIWGIVLILMKKKTMKSQVPFAPFLLLGAALVIFLPLIFPAIKFWIMYF